MSDILTHRSEIQAIEFGLQGNPQRKITGVAPFHYRLLITYTIYRDSHVLIDL